MTIAYNTNGLVIKNDHLSTPCLHNYNFVINSRSNNSYRCRKDQTRIIDYFDTTSDTYAEMSSSDSVVYANYFTSTSVMKKNLSNWTSIWSCNIKANTSVTTVNGSINTYLSTCDHLGNVYFAYLQREGSDPYYYYIVKIDSDGNKSGYTVTPSTGESQSLYGLDYYNGKTYHLYHTYQSGDNGYKLYEDSTKISDVNLGSSYIVLGLAVTTNGQVYAIKYDGSDYYLICIYGSGSNYNFGSNRPYQLRASHDGSLLTAHYDGFDECIKKISTSSSQIWSYTPAYSSGLTSAIKIDKYGDIGSKLLWVSRAGDSYTSVPSSATNHPLSVWPPLEK